ncbi:tRNA 2-thiouridine synthesizing protein B [Azomonas agilis]|uniref:tRNA 2-thiouridine synthesizing protein B n=1 Tax=Azomonas agilis TaxID=116849 RepID=A0A562HZD0_9GAMM|nr:sulfurtransferase complex subunit TusB [Azomonas agilis]TWH63904.1 tRNA 2-thiouridine synthesizing protein B [Azomonas agilis]
MATLHLLSQSPFTNTQLKSCLRLLGDTDGLMLCGDAVYVLNSAPELAPELQVLAAKGALYALEEDQIARNCIQEGVVQSLNYAQFVALCCQYDRVNSWV